MTPLDAATALEVTDSTGVENSLVPRFSSFHPLLKLEVLRKTSFQVPRNFIRWSQIVGFLTAHFSKLLRNSATAVDQEEKAIR